MLSKVEAFVQRLLAALPHPWRWVVTVAVGFLLVIGGIIMLPLPGPGSLVIVLGLTVLAVEFEWAREAVRHSRSGLTWVVQRLKDLWNKLRNR